MNELILSNKIILDKNELKNIDFKKYIYTNNQGEFIKHFNLDNNYIYFPLNLSKFKQCYRGDIEKFKIIDKRVKFDIDINFKSEFTLRDYQKSVIEEIKKCFQKNNPAVLLEAPTGFGKSFLLSYILQYLKQRTLILVDNKNLLTQIVNELNTFLDKEVNIIEKNNKTIRDINITTIQFLLKNKDYLNEIKDKFGLIVIDEAHLIGARVFTDVIEQFNSYYRYGMSATPTRSDGLDEMIEDIFEYKVKGFYRGIDIEVHRIFIDEFLISSNSYQQAIETLLLNNKIQQALKIMLDFYINKLNKQVMIAINNNIVQNFYYNLVKENITDKVAIIRGDTKKSDRDRILEKYDNSEIKVIIGYNVLKKGISIPRMDILINLFSATTKENVKQLIGRLSRIYEGKRKAYFIDFNLVEGLNRQQKVKYNALKSLKNEFNVKIKDFMLYNYLRLLKD